jgi:Phospholipase_D-nuclease N-terminal
VQVGLLVRALWDLWRRPADQINGSKLLWAPLCFVNFIGPLAYFRWGRRR